MKPRLVVMSYTPYGTARPSASPGKSCTLTAIGSSDQVWPAFLKSPTSSPLFLGVCTDDRQPSRSERRALFSNVVELPPTVGVIRRGFHLFGIDVQRVVELAQQAAHRGRTDRVTRRLQLGAQRARLLRTHFCAVIGSPAVSGATNSSSTDKIKGVFFDRRSTSTGLADPVGRSVHQRRSQLLSSTPNGLLIDPSDLHQQPVGPPAHALRFKRQVPAALVFVKTTQEQVRLLMSLSFRMGFASAAWAALAGVDRLGWHPSVLHRRSMAALYPNGPLDRKSPNPGSNCFTRPKNLRRRRKRGFLYVVTGKLARLLDVIGRIDQAQRVVDVLGQFRRDGAVHP